MSQPRSRGLMEDLSVNAPILSSERCAREHPASLMLDSPPAISFGPETELLIAWRPPSHPELEVAASGTPPVWSERELDARLRLLRGVFERHSASGQGRWGDKTCHTDHMARRAVSPTRCFSDRWNPGGTATSLMQSSTTRGSPRWLTGRHPAIWSLRGALGYRVAVCRYEDLVSEPERCCATCWRGTALVGFGIAHQRCTQRGPRVSTRPNTRGLRRSGERWESGGCGGPTAMMEQSSARALFGRPRGPSLRSLCVRRVRSRVATGPSREHQRLGTPDRSAPPRRGRES